MIQKERRDQITEHLNKRFFEMRQTVRSLSELSNWICSNGELFSTNQQHHHAIGWDLDTVMKFTQVEFYEVEYHAGFSKVFPRWKGCMRANFGTVRCFYPNVMFKDTGINLGKHGSSSYRSFDYPVLLFPEEWPGLCATATYRKLSGSTSDDIY